MEQDERDAAYSAWFEKNYAFLLDGTIVDRRTGRTLSRMPKMPGDTRPSKRPTPPRPRLTAKQQAARAGSSILAGIIGLVGIVLLVAVLVAAMNPTGH